MEEFINRERKREGAKRGGGEHVGGGGAMVAVGQSV